MGWVVKIQFHIKGICPDWHLTAFQWNEDKNWGIVQVQIAFHSEGSYISHRNKFLNALDSNVFVTCYAKLEVYVPPDNQLLETQITSNQTEE